MATRIDDWDGLGRYRVSLTVEFCAESDFEAESVVNALIDRKFNGVRGRGYTEKRDLDVTIEREEEVQNASAGE